MKVQDVMTPNPETCSRGSNLATAAMMMWRCDCGVIPVLDDDGTIQGVITDRDICMAVATQHRLADDIRVEEVMSREVHAVHPDDDIETAQQRMRSGKVRRLPVVRPDGRLAGVISISDLILHANPSRRDKRDGISTDEVMSVLRTISGHGNGAETARL